MESGREQIIRKKQKEKRTYDSTTSDNIFCIHDTLSALQYGVQNKRLLRKSWNIVP